MRTAFNDRALMEEAIAETYSMRSADVAAWMATNPRAGVPRAFEANPGMGNAMQMWPSRQDMNMVNDRYFRELQVNPAATPAPTRIFWGPGNADNTIFYPGFGKTPTPNR